MLEIHQKPNLPGIATLSIIADRDFDENGEALIEAFTEDLLFSHRSCVLDISQLANSNGTAWQAAINMRMPMISTNLQDFLLKYSEMRWVVLVKDFNDYSYIIGEPKNGARLTVSMSTGGEQNSSDFSFSAMSLQPFKVSTENLENMYLAERVLSQSIYIDAKKQGDTISHLLNGKVYIDAFIDDSGELIRDPGFAATFTDNTKFVFGTNMPAEFINDTFTGYLICKRYA